MILYDRLWNLLEKTTKPPSQRLWEAKAACGANYDQPGKRVGHHHSTRNRLTQVDPVSLGLTGSGGIRRIARLTDQYPELPRAMCITTAPHARWPPAEQRSSDINPVLTDVHFFRTLVVKASSSGAARAKESSQTPLLRDFDELPSPLERVHPQTSQERFKRRGRRSPTTRGHRSSTKGVQVVLGPNTP